MQTLHRKVPVLATNIGIKLFIFLSLPFSHLSHYETNTSYCTYYFIDYYFIKVSFQHVIHFSCISET